MPRITNFTVHCSQLAQQHLQPSPRTPPLQVMQTRSCRNVRTSCQPKTEIVYNPLRKGLVNRGKCILYIVECHVILNMSVPGSCSPVLLSLVAYSPTGCLQPVNLVARLTTFLHVRVDCSQTFAELRAESVGGTGFPILKKVPNPGNKVQDICSSILLVSCLKFQYL